MITELLNEYKIKEYDNFMIFNFSLSGVPYYLITDDDLVLICTHCNKDGIIHDRERVIRYINQFPGREIELICCYPNRAKEDYELGKYIKINSDNKILFQYETIEDNNEFTQIAYLLEKLEN